MKKTFPLEAPEHAPQRVIASIKNDVRKYLKRERRKPLPEGVDFWDFDCRVGRDQSSAEETHVNEIIERIDLASREGWTSVYMEILARGGHRAARTESSGPEMEGGLDGDAGAQEYEPKNRVEGG